MGRYNIIHYKDLIQLVVSVDSFGGVGCRQYYSKVGFTKGKTAYCLPASGERTDYDLTVRYDGRTNNIHGLKKKLEEKNCNVFVSPACKLNREIIRNSGYKIVMDKDKADYIVVPQLYFPEYLTTNMVLSNDESIICLVKIRYTSDYISFPFSDEQLEKVESCVRSWIIGHTGYSVDNLVRYNSDGADEMRVCFVKRSEELELLFNDDNANYKFISEVKLPLMPSYEMNLDTIEVMMHCQDHELLTKMVQATDWQNYPLTLCCVLAKHPYTVLRNEATKPILSAIGWDEFYYNNPREWGTNRIISPDDWNLAQKLILRGYNVDDENGGFIPIDNGKNIDRDSGDWLKWTRRRLVVKPYYISEPTPFSTLIDIVQKS